MRYFQRRKVRTDIRLLCNVRRYGQSFAASALDLARRSFSSFAVNVANDNVAAALSRSQAGFLAEAYIAFELRKQVISESYRCRRLHYSSA